jgi:hypothetical protein
MTIVNRLIFNKIDFQNSEDYYAAISKQIQLLIETNNVITIATPVNPDGTTNNNSIIIKYNPKDPKLKLPYPCWLYPDEIEYVAVYHNDVEAAMYQELLDDYNKNKEKGSLPIKNDDKNKA